MLKVIEHIKKYGLDSLTEKFAISIKRHSAYDNLVLLKYNQIDSPMGNQIVQECRGLILDELHNWNIVCYTYSKFFNYGEGHAANIDWETAKVFEKLDGSLCQLYYYDNEWQVASSGRPDASGEVMGTDTTFRELFWKVWNDSGYSLPLDKDKCYAFELCTPYNRIVVRHKASRIVLHGARRLSDLKELNPIVVAYQNKWECAQTYPLNSWEDIIEVAKTLDPMESEGYVVCDTDYNRVKVKSPQYVAVAHLKDAFTTRRLLEIVRTNENSEFLSYYPEYNELYCDIKAKYENKVGFIEGFYEAIKEIDDRKQFALTAKEQDFSGILFGIKYGTVRSVRSAIADMNIKHLEKWLGMKSIEL